ncbi:hypothetical protein LNKW23_47050 [Paralimibaculum aggregatum]|uniref:Uncharacterized protein n=1 Tax=Paralimibaculum aggregatum TaxID=3036245 RepID=A0ABQ6LTT7_9RHOB|nr:hypothetical protein LNKW23_47050 [Limibaculum sp. NKW23]
MVVRISVRSIIGLPSSECRTGRSRQPAHDEAQGLGCRDRRQGFGLTPAGQDVQDHGRRMDAVGERLGARGLDGWQAI